MFKKTIIVMIVAVLLLTSIPTLAATPSKTTEDLTRIITVAYEDGSKHNELITIQEEPTKFEETLIKDLLTFKAANKDILDFFDASVQKQIQALLPQNVSVDGFILSELVCLCCGDHDQEHGNIACEIEFPTEYKETDVVVPLLGYQDAQGNTAWLPVKAQVKDGHIVVEFTEEVLALVGHDFVLTVLSK